MSLRSATLLALLLAGAVSAYYPTYPQHHGSYGSASHYDAGDQWEHQPQQQWKPAEYEDHRDTGHLASQDTHGYASPPPQPPVQGFQSGAPFLPMGQFQTPINSKFPDVCPGLTLPLRTSSFDPALYLSDMGPYSVPTVEAVRTSSRGCAGCKLRHVHLLSRHGSRFPSSGDRDEFDKLQQFVANARPPNARFAWIPQWRNPVTPAMAENLHPRGWKDLCDLATRDQLRYKPYLTKEEFQSYPEHFEARSSFAQRVIDSGTAYLQQIFGANAGPKLRSSTKENPDKVIRPWDACPAYKPTVKAPAIAGPRKQRQEAALRPITQRLSQQVLGKPFSSEAEVKLVWTMFAACQMGRALCRQDAGQWCNVFTESEFQQLHRVKETECWLEDGPGLPLNNQMAGPMIRTMVADMKQVAKSDDSLNTRPQFKLWFGHSETIMRLFGGLNLLKPPGTGAPNAFDPHKHMPFAANIHLELWQNPEAPATGGSSSSKYPGYFVRLLVNERPVVMPLCVSHGLFCPLAEFIKATKTVAKYDLEQVCKVNEW